MPNNLMNLNEAINMTALFKEESNKVLDPLYQDMGIFRHVKHLTGNFLILYSATPIVPVFVSIREWMLIKNNGLLLWESTQ